MKSRKQKILNNRIIEIENRTMGWLNYETLTSFLILVYRNLLVHQFSRQLNEILKNNGYSIIERLKWTIGQEDDISSPAAQQNRIPRQILHKKNSMRASNSKMAPKPLFGDTD